MNGSPPDPVGPVAQSQGWLIALATLLGTVLTPAAVWCAMLAYNRFDPMCGTGAEGDIACVTRAFVVTMMAILPGLLIGVASGVFLAARRGRKAHPVP